jgi:hypothetical protein
MTAEIHPIEKEQVMAYLDGELSSAETGRVAAHLDQCVECRVLAADFRELSARMMDWSVEPSPATLTADIMSAAAKDENHLIQKSNISLTFFTTPWWRFQTPRWVWPTAIGVAFLVIAITTGIPQMKYSRIANSVPPLSPPDIADYAMKLPKDAKALNNSASEAISAPLIARTATLAISVRNFEAARSSMDQIVRARKGYVGELKITSPKGGPQSLETTLRIPAAQFDAALADLKALGRVEQEQQGGEEVTAQIVDLEARLKNARETEARLAEVLRTRTGKIDDVLEVEKEMARVREEIEQMEAEQKGLNNRVAFASIDLNLTEEYQSQLNGGRSMVWLQIRNALVDGYGNAADGFVNVLVLILSVGPSLLIWAAVLVWPARWAWKRWRKTIPGDAAGT